MGDYAVVRVLDIWYDKITVDRFTAHISDPDRREIAQRRLEKARQILTSRARLIPIPKCSGRPGLFGD